MTDTKERVAKEAILRMVAAGDVPTPARVNAVLGVTYATHGISANRLNGRLTAFRTEVMLQAGFFRAHKDDTFSGHWFPPGAEIPEGWSRDAD